jgi:hypothetical protein
MAVPDYVQIQESLVELLTQVPGLKNIFLEGSEAEVGNLAHMPLANVRLTEAASELVRLPNGYNEQVTLLVDILAFDFTSYAAAARLRSGLLRTARALLLVTPQFDAQILTSQLNGGVSFGAFTAEGNRGHVAVATYTVICEIDVEV